MSEIAQLAYVVLLAFLAPFGAHRFRLLWLRLRRPRRAEAERWSGPLPIVTVQLPVYNEANVVERLIDAVCRLDYPTALLEIQLLDDSDDETVDLAARRVRRWQERGVDIHHIRRKSRDGFKAGALAYGTTLARGEFFLVLDADFVPSPELVRDLLPPFSDAGVGAVQAAWDHFSPDANWLTRAQALLLDAHFAIEHEARYRAGLFFNFNGSGGMWRRECVRDAGGWRADTLTEDVDLSYRGQLGGWRFAYLDHVRVPAELPSTLRAVEIQQRRWAQGGMQCARLLLPRIWRASLPGRVKLEAMAHLAGHVVHPLTLSLGATLAIAGWMQPEPGLPGIVHVAGVCLATVPFVLFYGTAGVLRKRGRLGRRIAEALLLGLGLGVPLAFAVLRGLAGRRAPFVRTPKRGFAPSVVYSASVASGASWLRVVLAVALLGAIANAASSGLVAAIPFTGLFALGYILTTREVFWPPRRQPVGAGPPPTSGPPAAPAIPG